MRYNKVLEKVWNEYIVHVDRGDGMVIPICGLCGGSGVIDTYPTTIYRGNAVGVKKPCICPNGRTIKGLGSVPQ